MVVEAARMSAASRVESISSKQAPSREREDKSRQAMGKQVGSRYLRATGIKSRCIKYQIVDSGLLMRCVEVEKVLVSDQRRGLETHSERTFCQKYLDRERTRGLGCRFQVAEGRITEVCDANFQSGAISLRVCVVVAGQKERQTEASFFFVTNKVASLRE